MRHRSLPEGWLRLGLCAVACLAWSARAHAAVEVDAPPGCGSSAEFEGEVRPRIGAEARVPDTRVRIESTGRGYRLSMRVGAELREVEDSDCRELFRAAVVILVSIVLAEPRPSERRDAPPAAVAVPPPARRERAQPSPRSFTAGLGLGAGVNAGFLPRPGLFAELEAEFAVIPRWGLGLGARYLAPRDAQDDDLRGVSVRGWGGTAVATFEPHRIVRARLGFSAYRLVGTGLGSPVRSDDVAWAGGPTAGVVFFPLRRARDFIGLGAEVELHVLRPRFEILNYGEVFAAPAAGGLAFLRVGRLFF